MYLMWNVTEKKCCTALWFHFDRFSSGTINRFFKALETPRELFFFTSTLDLMLFVYSCLLLWYCKLSFKRMLVEWEPDGLFWCGPPPHTRPPSFERRSWNRQSLLRSELKSHEYELYSHWKRCMNGTFDLCISSELHLSSIKEDFITRLGSVRLCSEDILHNPSNN